MSFLEKLKSLFKEEVPAPVIEQKPVELKKRTKKLVSRKEMVDLGVTSVLLKFQDGRELITKVYGEFVASAVFEGNDESDYGRPLVEPYIYQKEFNDNSIQRAEKFLKTVGKIGRKISVDGIVQLTQSDRTYVDDPRKPTVSFVGKVISAQIIKTEQCLEEVTKYSVEPI